MRNTYYVYILARRRNGTLYIGVTNNLLRRIYEHKKNIIKGFTSKYKVDKLVYFEQTDDIHSAIAREKQLKKYNRSWKLNMIENLIRTGMNYIMSTEVQMIYLTRCIKMTLDSRLRGNDNPPLCPPRRITC